MDRSRRSFFRNFCLRKTVNLVCDVSSALKQGASESDYFDSFENSYPLISEYAYFIDDEISDLGIETTGKNSLEVAEEVYKKRSRNK